MFRGGRVVLCRGWDRMGPPSVVNIVTVFDNDGQVGLDNTSLSVPQFQNRSLTVSQGTSSVTSASLVNDGSVDVYAGTLTLPDSLPQLAGGTLTGGAWATLAGVLVLPADITSLRGAQVSVDGASAEIQNRSFASALAGLSSIDSASSLEIGEQASLSLKGSLTSSGTVIMGGYDGGGSVILAGTYTQAGSSLSLNQTTLTAQQVQIDAGADLGGIGTIHGTLVNNGAVASYPGISVTGNYVQGATGLLEAVRALTVKGTATLAGALDPGGSLGGPPGSSSPAITFASATGRFTSHGLGFHVVAKPTEVDVVNMPQIAASPSSAAPGSEVTLSGADFSFQAIVVFYLDNTNTRIGSAKDGNHGNVSMTGTIPTSATVGRHTVIAIDSAGRKAKTKIQIT